MPGLFGGNSKDEQQAQQIAATPAPYMANYPTGINQSQPGQLDMLSQNLAAGGFGNGSPAALKNWMDTFYTASPMAIYGGPQPAAAPAAAVAAPSAAPAAAKPYTPRVNYYRHAVGTGDGGQDWEFGGGKNSR
jgi:hypothetical protein